jgi:hypothetical protein
MSKNDERDVREEIKIAIFWRNLIGDFEYIKFDPDDMMRWFDALELRGPIEIRHLLRERYATRPVNAMLGITSRAPHPPTWLVREWLAFYEQKVSTRPAWLTAFGFVVLSFMAFPLLHQCADLQPVSMYVMNPPSSGPTIMPNSQVMTSIPASNMAPPATAQPGPTGPRSAGIAGAATGVTQTGGATGAVNGGISAGSISPGAAVGSGVP